MTMQKITVSLPRPLLASARRAVREGRAGNDSAYVASDAGALSDRNDRFVVSLLARSLELELGIAVPAGVVAQVWRDGRRQARLARLLGAPQVEVEVLDDRRARAAGQLCGVAKTRDIVDASVVLCARARAHSVATSDQRDLRRLDRQLPLIPV